MLWSWFADTLRHHPDMALFLTLALGYWIGKIRIADMTLGVVVGVLLAGVVIGQLDIKVSSDLKTVFFLLFLFAIGYRTGPQFFGGLRGSGLPQVALAVVLCGSGLAAGYGLARTFGYDAGTAAGLLAGGLTASAAVGTATDAINRLGLEAATTQQLASNVAVAFAVTYFLGVITTVTLLARVAPRLLRVDLAAQCAALEQEMGLISGDVDTQTGYQLFVARALRIGDTAYAGKTVGEIERAAADRAMPCYVLRVRRGNELIEPDTTMRLERRDVIALYGRRPYVLAEQSALGAEADDVALLDFPIETLDVVVTSKAIVGKTLGELIAAHPHDTRRGVGLRKVSRAGVELPWTRQTRLARGDVLTLHGLKPNVERLAGILGYADVATPATNMAAVGAAIFIGGMIGIPALALHGAEIGLSQSVGVLLGGLVFGWLRAVDRRFSRVPEGALWLFDSLGLAAFLAISALAAGPSFIAVTYAVGNVLLALWGSVIVALMQAR